MRLVIAQAMAIAVAFVLLVLPIHFYRFSTAADNAGDVVAAVGASIIFIFVFGASSPLVVRRLHDLDLSGRWLWLFLVPCLIAIAPSVVPEEFHHRFAGPTFYVALFLAIPPALVAVTLLVKPGSRIPNRFGAPPGSRSP